ncbi:MAG: hypothetical protein HOZ81_24800 [Streptomyces sp.]|nr:hypothetical protein [Streptomyces sp.]
MSRNKAPADEPEEPSRAAGACVLVVLGGVLVAIAFAIDEAVGVLFVVVAGTVALWRSVRRTANPAPPPGQERPSCRECAGHELLSVTPLKGAQKGMLIYTSASPDTPNRTHVHIVGTAVSPPA